MIMQRARRFFPGFLCNDVTTTDHIPIKAVRIKKIMRYKTQTILLGYAAASFLPGMLHAG